MAKVVGGVIVSAVIDGLINVASGEVAELFLGRKLHPEPLSKQTRVIGPLAGNFCSIPFINC